MSGYIKKGNQWYLNGQLVKAGDQGYDRFGNLNQMQSDGTWKTLKKATAEGKEARKNNLFTPKQYNAWKPKQGPESFAGKIIKGFGDWTGFYHLGNNASDLIGMGAYLAGPVGNVLSAGDAINDLKKGNYGSAAMNAVFALPVVGQIGRGVQLGLRAAKLAKTANAIGKGIRTVEKISPVANKGLNYTMLAQMPSMAKGLYDGYQSTAQQKKQVSNMLKGIDKARKSGMSEQQIKGYLGDSYDMLNTLGKRDNSFTGNLGTMWDLMSQE